MVTNHCNQYLNCKILHGGVLLQPWPYAFGMRKYFRPNYVFLSAKSCEDQNKKSSSSKIEEFLSPKSSEDQKKKKHLHCNLGLNWARICGICSCLQALYHLINQCSNLDGGTHLPYNLSSNCNQRCNQDFWLGVAQATNNMQWRYKFSKEELFVGQRYLRMKDPKPCLLLAISQDFAKEKRLKLIVKRYDCLTWEMCWVS